MATRVEFTANDLGPNGASVTGMQPYTKPPVSWSTYRSGSVPEDHYTIEMDPDSGAIGYLCSETTIVTLPTMQDSISVSILPIALTTRIYGVDANNTDITGSYKSVTANGNVQVVLLNGPNILSLRVVCDDSAVMTALQWGAP